MQKRSAFWLNSRTWAGVMPSSPGQQKRPTIMSWKPATQRCQWPGGKFGDTASLEPRRVYFHFQFRSALFCSVYISLHPFLEPFFFVFSETNHSSQNINNNVSCLKTDIHKTEINRWHPFNLSKASFTKGNYIHTPCTPCFISTGMHCWVHPSDNNGTTAIGMHATPVHSRAGSPIVVYWDTAAEFGDTHSHKCHTGIQWLSMPPLCSNGHEWDYPHRDATPVNKT